jgi:hypothetical protein
MLLKNRIIKKGKDRKSDLEVYSLNPQFGQESVSLLTHDA